MPVEKYNTALFELVVDVQVAIRRDGPTQQGYILYIVDVHLPVVTELKRAFAVLLSECVRLIDFGILWELAIRFHWHAVSVYPKDRIVLTHSCEPHLLCTSL